MITVGVTDDKVLRLNGKRKLCDAVVGVRRPELESCISFAILFHYKRHNDPPKRKEIVFHDIALLAKAS